MSTQDYNSVINSKLKEIEDVFGEDILSAELCFSPRVSHPKFITYLIPMAFADVLRKVIKNSALKEYPEKDSLQYVVPALPKVIEQREEQGGTWTEEEIYSRCAQAAPEQLTRFVFLDLDCDDTRFDNTRILEVLKDVFGSFSWIAIPSSSNYIKGHPKFRIIVPLQQLPDPKPEGEEAVQEWFEKVKSWFSDLLDGDDDNKLMTKHYLDASSFKPKQPQYLGLATPHGFAHSQTPLEYLEQWIYVYQAFDAETGDTSFLPVDEIVKIKPKVDSTFKLSAATTVITLQEYLSHTPEEKDFRKNFHIWRYLDTPESKDGSHRKASYYLFSELLMFHDGSRTAAKKEFTEVVLQRCQKLGIKKSNSDIDKLFASHSFNAASYQPESLFTPLFAKFTEATGIQPVGRYAEQFRENKEAFKESKKAEKQAEQLEMLRGYTFTPYEDVDTDVLYPLLPVSKDERDTWENTVISSSKFKNHYGITVGDLEDVMSAAKKYVNTRFTINSQYKVVSKFGEDGTVKDHFDKLVTHVKKVSYLKGKNVFFITKRDYSQTVNSLLDGDAVFELRRARLREDIKHCPERGKQPDMLDPYLDLIGFKEKFHREIIKYFLWTIKRKVFDLNVANPIYLFIYGGQHSGKTTFLKHLGSPFGSFHKKVTPLGDDSQHTGRLRHIFFGSSDEAPKIKSENTVEALKELITAQDLFYRKLYDPGETEFKNTISFAQAANKRMADVIHDTTGGRRFFEVIQTREPDLTNLEVFNRITSFDIVSALRQIDENSVEMDQWYEDNYLKIRATQRVQNAVDPIDEYITERKLNFAPDSKDFVKIKLTDAYQDFVAFYRSNRADSRVTSTRLQFVAALEKAGAPVITSPQNVKYLVIDKKRTEIIGSYSVQGCTSITTVEQYPLTPSERKAIQPHIEKAVIEATKNPPVEESTESLFDVAYPETPLKVAQITKTLDNVLLDHALPLTIPHTAHYTKPSAPVIAQAAEVCASDDTEEEYSEDDYSESDYYGDDDDNEVQI